MKIKSQLYLVDSANLNSGIDRASATVGVAIRDWLREETAKEELQFSDIALALHYVVSREAVTYALSQCQPHRQWRMKRQYGDLVMLCLDDQFDRLTRVRKNGL